MPKKAHVSFLLVEGRCEGIVPCLLHRLALGGEKVKRVLVNSFQGVAAVLSTNTTLGSWPEPLPCPKRVLHSTGVEPKATFGQPLGVINSKTGSGCSKRALPEPTLRANKSTP